MFTSFRKCEICHLHISHNAPYLPPKILHKLCFSFLLSITAVPREIENRAYAKFFLGGGGREGVKLGALWEMCKWHIRQFHAKVAVLYNNCKEIYKKARCLCKVFLLIYM